MDRDKLESQIAFYSLSDPKYIETVFVEKATPISYFSDDGIRRVMEITVDYYGRFGKTIPKEEFNHCLQEKLNKKEINQAEHHGAARAFKKAKDWEDAVTEDQFDRIFYDFLSVAKNREVREVVLKNKDLLDKFKTLEYIEKVSEEFDKLRVNSSDTDHVRVLDAFEDIEEQIKDVIERRDRQVIGIPTGIAAVDSKFSGFEKKTLSLVVAITSQGKSTFVLNVSRNIAELYDKKVLIFSLEMPPEQWLRKYNSLDFWVPYTYIQRGNKELLPDEKFEDFIEKIKQRKEKDRKAEYKVIGTPAGVYSFKDLIRLKEKKLPLYKPDIIFIDQLSLIRIPGVKSKTDELGDLTKEIRAYGEINDVPMVVVAQANRAAIIRKGATREIDINVENIEDSNKVGADADNVIALMSPPGSGGHRILVRIVKQRDGETGTVEIASRLDYCAMLDAESPRIASSMEGFEENEDEEEEVFGEEYEEDDTGLGEMSGGIQGLESATSIEDSLQNFANELMSEMFDDEDSEEPSVDKKDDPMGFF